jgi:tetratricopeptide (TPR) repeat protein
LQDIPPCALIFRAFPPDLKKGDTAMKSKAFLICVIIVLTAPGYLSLADESPAGSGNKAVLSEPVLCPSGNEAARKSYNNGLKLVDEGNLDGARKEYQKAIDLDPNYCDAMDNLGQLFRRQGKLDDAIYWYKRSIGILPGNRAAHTNLAVAYRYQGNKDAAISEYRILLKMNPRDPEGYYGLGTVYLGFKDLGAASEQFRKAEQLYLEQNSPLVSDARYLLGVTYYQMKDYEKSIDYLERVYGAKQNDSRVSYFLGLSYLERGDIDRAAKYLRRAQELGAKIPPEVLQKAGI